MDVPASAFVDRSVMFSGVTGFIGYYPAIRIAFLADIFAFWNPVSHAT
jgi:hypothetical protein